MLFGRVVLLESGETGERMAESRSLVGARTWLRPKLLNVELGEDLIEVVEDEFGEVILLEGLFDDRCRGL